MLPAWILYATTLALLLLCLYALRATRRLYSMGKPLTGSVSASWLVVDTLDTLVIVLASASGLWRIPIEGTPALLARILGAALVAVGITLMALGMAEFRSARKIVGLEVSTLITTGIYSRSRNPQFLGWYLAVLGVALAGLSGYALLIALLTIVFGHYYIVRLEEPFLERVFGEEYIEYKRRVPRYLRLVYK